MTSTTTRTAEIVARTAAKHGANPDAITTTIRGLGLIETAARRIANAEVAA